MVTALDPVESLTPTSILSFKFDYRTLTFS